MESSVPLLRHDPSDLGSLILTRIKKRAVRNVKLKIITSYLAVLVEVDLQTFERQLHQVLSGFDDHELTGLFVTD